MSSINISSLLQSTGSTSLLNYLNNDDDDNSIMSTLITNKRAEFESTLSKYGYSTSSSSDNSAYTKMESSNEALLDAISKLSSDSLYTAADGEEYDNSSLLTSVNNFVTAYNSSISNLTSTGGVLYSQYYSKLQDTFTDNAEALNKIGLSLGSDGKITIDQDTLSAALADDIKSALGSGSAYTTSVSSTLTSINGIISTALSYASSSYTSSGTLSCSLLSTYTSSV